MASSSGGFRATDEIPEVETEIVEPAPEEPGRVGSKRVRDNGMGSHGFRGVNTEKNASISNHMLTNSDGNSKIGGSSSHGERTLPDFNNLRSSISSPGKNLGNKIKRPSKICAYYSQGRCSEGNSCTFIHEIDGPGSDYRWNNEEKAGLPAADAYGKSRGSEERSQFKDSDGLTKEKLCRSLCRLYGEAGKSVPDADKQSTFTPGVSQGMSSRFYDTLNKKLTSPINEMVLSPVVHEKKQELSMGHHSGLTSKTNLNGRGTVPRLPDRGIFQSAADKGTYLDITYSDAKFQNPLRCNEKLSAYGGTEVNLPNTHQKEHLSSYVPYSSYSLPGFRNPHYATSDHSLGSSTLCPTSQLGRLSQHLPSPVMEKVGSHKYVDVGAGTSRPALLASSSPQPAIVAPGSPIKDEVWVTSVPFVPSFDFPDIKTPPRKQYDPLVDYIDSPKVHNKNILKSSISSQHIDSPKVHNKNILKSSSISSQHIDSPKVHNKNILKSSGISSQHTNPYIVTPKSLNHDGKLARNMSAKGSNELAHLIASDREHNSTLDDNNKVKIEDRKPNAASNNEKTRNFRFRLAHHVKGLITPDWMKGYLSKDAHKLVVKKTIDKVLSSFKLHQVPTCEDEIMDYILVNKSKIENLVKAYVDRHRTA